MNMDDSLIIKPCASCKQQRAGSETNPSKLKISKKKDLKLASENVNLRSISLFMRLKSIH